LDFRRGDLIQVEWVDIQEEPTGDPRKAHLYRRMSYGIFWDTKDDWGKRCLVTTTTMDPDPESSGWCIYPEGCLVEVKLVRRSRAKKAAAKRKPRPNDPNGVGSP
jgi:hypothetical protein